MNIHKHLVDANLPNLYTQENVGDPTVKAHLFFIPGNFDWWIVEYDPQRRLAFGYACLNDSINAELGYIHIPELQDLSQIGLGVEFDLYWEEKPLSEIMAKIRIG